MADIFFFPGGNTPGGFVNHFDDILPLERARRVYFIKGGSGVGKSTFMRAVAEHCAQKGHDVEYFNCSSDPQSLDGMAIPALGVAMMDGTAPHIMDPRMPGVRDHLLDLGRFLDEAALAGRRETLERIMPRRAACFARAYVYLSAALPLYDAAGRAAISRPADEVCAEICEALALEGGRGGKRGRLRHLFADAFTPDGLVSVLDTLNAGLRINVRLPWGGDASEALMRAAERACALGEDAVLLLDPMRPERALHLYLPGRSALVCAGDGLMARGGRFDAEIAGARAGNTPAFDREEFDRLVNAAIARLHDAREMHVDVENIYSSAMDFEGVRALRERVICDVDAIKP